MSLPMGECGSVYEARLRRAVERLTEKRDGLRPYEVSECARLNGKIEGVKLALSYLDDESRLPRERSVCIAHGRFVPCLSDGVHRYSANSFWVKSVRDYQGSTIDDLTWEPAWESSPSSEPPTCSTSCDPDCIVTCHEVHQPTGKRTHDVQACIRNQLGIPSEEQADQ